jgi:hypothetical protein
MQLGQELGTGFVSDDAQATVGGEVAPPPEGADAQAPEVSPLPAPEPEPTAAS